MSNAKQSWLQKFKIPNSNIKKLLENLRKKIAFDLFSPNSKPLQYHHSRFWIIFSAKNELIVFFLIAFLILLFILLYCQNLSNLFDLLLLIHPDYPKL